jgi:hypothetical protein
MVERGHLWNGRTLPYRIARAALRIAVECVGARWPGPELCHPNRFRFLNLEQFDTILP